MASRRGCSLARSAALEATEAALTGESLPVKTSDWPARPKRALADRRNMIYSGTHLTAGRGRAVVVATGLQTEVGKIAISRRRGGPEDAAGTSARAIRDAGSWRLGVLFVFHHRLWICCAAFRSVDDFHGRDQPDGVDGAGGPARRHDHCAGRRHAAHGAARRHRAPARCGGDPGIHQHHLQRQNRHAHEERDDRHVALMVAGRADTSTSPALVIHRKALLRGKDNADIAMHSRPCALLEAVPCSATTPSSCRPTTTDPRWRALGDPTEAALLTSRSKVASNLEALRKAQPRQAEIPVRLRHEDDGDAARPRVARTHLPQRRARSIDSTLRLRAAWGEHGAARYRHTRRTKPAAALPVSALRVLAVAEIPNDAARSRPALSQLTRQAAVLLGLIGRWTRRAMKWSAVEECQKAGIRPVMVTGDHKATGLAIATDAGHRARRRPRGGRQ
jgi:hypothetical protein